ncbi:MAG: methyltransferase [Polyangiales bacterium]
MARRDPEALLRALEDPGFTPARRDVQGLVVALASAPESLTARIERALLEQPDEAVARLTAHLAAAQGDRSRTVHALGRLAATGAAPWSALHAALEDGDAAVRKAAVTALAQSTDPSTEAALLAAWDREGDAVALRPMLRALGRVGTAAAAARLDAVPSDEARIADELARAKLMLQRRSGREDESAIVGDTRAPRPLAVDVACRPGLERICADEFTDGFLAAPAGTGRVQVTLRGTLDELARCRVMTGFSFPLSARVTGDPVAAVIDALCSDEAQEILGAFTRGVVRYRVEWLHAGHRRGATWRVATGVQARCPELVNDSRDATWNVLVDASEGGRITLHPRRWVDPRFTWRVAEVPAASHPTVAAALASFAGVRPDDVVWDPFVGSALELVERARRGPYRRMIGTDVDASALDAARRNLDAAGVERVTLHRGDATVDPPTGVSLILTNPPHGHRANFGRDPAELLTRFVAVAHRALRPGGRVAWLSPAPKETADAARALGMSVRLGAAVDLGGVPVTLQALGR